MSQRLVSKLRLARLESSVDLVGIHGVETLNDILVPLGRYLPLDLQGRSDQALVERLRAEVEPLDLFEAECEGRLRDREIRRRVYDAIGIVYAPSKPVTHPFSLPLW